MAARRERERRRPSPDRRYSFATPETALDPDTALAGANGDQPASAVEASGRSRAARESGFAAQAAARATRVSDRPAALPFSHYRTEYAYVLNDLRRVGVVIGSLLVVLIVLFFILPH